MKYIESLSLYSSVMAVIYYRFRSQKPTEMATVRFDGTGLTVFEFKREVILAKRLSPAADIDIKVFLEDRECQDDNEVLPRSCTAIVRRSAAQRKGHGNISRYVQGKPRLNTGAGATGSGAAAAKAAAAVVAGAGPEDDAVARMFADQDDQWAQQQSQLAQAQRVDTPRNQAKLDETIPPYYICYKCGEKGKHHIRNCPRNNDPKWDGVRIKKTTGIPKSHLKTIQVDLDGEAQDAVGGAGGAGGAYMVNAEGQHVVQVADSGAWTRFQQQQQQSKSIAQQQKQKVWQVTDHNKDLLDGSGRLFQQPVKMPCCGKVYSKQQIESVLIDNDFQCPNCHKDDIYLDSLVLDEDLQKKIDQFLANNEKEGGDKEAKEGETDEPQPKRQQTMPVMPMAMPPMPMMMPGMMPGMPFMPFMPPMNFTGVQNNSNNASASNNNNNGANAQSLPPLPPPPPPPPA